MASNSFPQYISSRVLTNPPLSAAAGRYEFLDLNNAEPNLSLPVKTANINAKSFLLSEPLLGTRYWSTSAQISLSGDNVGVGTNTPNEKLTILGNLSASGYIYGQVVDPVIPAAAGANEQVQYNANGILGGNAGFVYHRTLSSVVIGNNNSATGSQTSIVGGKNNSASGNSAFIGGGDGNQIVGGVAAFIGAGKTNSTLGDYSAIVGGRNNSAQDTFTVTVGGDNNVNQGYASFIGSGQDNTISSGTQFGAIVGGSANSITHNNAFILGSNIQSISGDTTHVENLYVKNHLIVNSSIAESFTTVSPLANVVAIDLDQGTTHNIVLTANVTDFNINSYVQNKVNSFMIIVKQDAVGGRTVTWTFNGLTLKWPNGGVSPTVTPGANAIDIFTFVTDGSDTWYGFSGSQNYV